MKANTKSSASDRYKEAHTMYLTISQDVIDYQISLAQQALHGDASALKTLAQNFGYFTGSGLNYYPDLDRAKIRAEKILATHSID